MALVFIVSAIFLWVTSLYAFANPRIRNLEEEIPYAFTDEPEAEIDPLPKSPTTKHSLFLLFDRLDLPGWPVLLVGDIIFDSRIVIGARDTLN